MKKPIKSAFISVFNKDGLEHIVNLLHLRGATIYSTGGTATFIEELGVPVIKAETLTGFPSILGDRVKTLHPKIFGGILKIRGNETHENEAHEHGIPEFDLVIIDLYPFQETVASGASDEQIIEKIDIGGVALIRAAAKNFNDVVIIPSKTHYPYLQEILDRGNETTIKERRYLAGCAFELTSVYDTAIRGYFQGNELRYGENPHQEAMFIGDLSESWDQLHGKEMSYNNLMDTEAAINMVYDFTEPAFAIIKHMNACGFAIDQNITTAFSKAFEADTKSAFGGIYAANVCITKKIAELIDVGNIFVEVIIAPGYEEGAVELLKKKINIRILKWKNPKQSNVQFRTCLTGIISQERDIIKTEESSDLKFVTKRTVSADEEYDLLIAFRIVKHQKSNAIVIVKNGQMLAMGCGQTSRIDALQNALSKAKEFEMDVRGAVMASEAFFPEPDCVSVAGKAGITAVIHPGGSKKDQDSIDVCDQYGMAMVTTGVRHFKH